VELIKEKVTEIVKTKQALLSPEEDLQANM